LPIGQERTNHHKSSKCDGTALFSKQVRAIILHPL
jgi:hypothetical protein